MRHRRTGPAPRNRTTAGEKGSLIQVDFLGSFPTANFDNPTGRPEIAVVGRSNVGKSSLINALLERRAMARTSKTPGKTRLLNIFDVQSLFLLVDFPGYGYAQVSKTERSSFKKLYYDYFKTREQLAGVLWLLDIRHDPSKDDLEMADLFARAQVPILVGATKADKISKNQRAARVRAILKKVGIPEDQCIVTSSEKKIGITELRETIDQFLK